MPSQTGEDGEAVNFDISAFFSDAQGDHLTYTADGLPPGLVIDPGTGVITGTIDKNGSQSAPYIVTITVGDPAGNLVSTQVVWKVTNPSPDAANETAYTLPSSPVVLGVLANDSDPDQDPLTIDSTTAPANGTVTINANGMITYTPNAGFTGTDTFTYTVADGNGRFNTATATVIVALDLTDLAAASALPAQTGQDGGTPRTFDASTVFSDPDGDPLTFSATGLPPGLMINPLTGEITGTIGPSASQGGIDPVGAPGVYVAVITAEDPTGNRISTSFRYTITNPPPMPVADTGAAIEDTSLVVASADGLLDNDADPDGDPMSIVSFTVPDVGTFTVGSTATIPGVGALVINADGSYTFTPDGNYDGAVPVVTYTVEDGDGAQATSTLALTITSVNDAPVALPGRSTTNYIIPVALDLLATASDVDGDPLTVVSATVSPELGAMFRVGSTWVFKPSPTFAGKATITYTVSDPSGLTSTSTHDVIVKEPELKAVGGKHVTKTKGPLSGVVSKEDSFPPGSIFQVLGSTKHGTLFMKPDGTFRYVPKPGYVGLDRFTYKITDPLGRVVAATEVIDVKPSSFIDTCFTTFSKLKKRVA